MTTLTLRPDGAGDDTLWTPNTGANYAAVDEASNDADTTYVARAGTEVDDLYSLATDAALTGAAISNVRVYASGKYVESGAGVLSVSPTLKLGVKSGGTEYWDAGDTITSSYADYYQDWATNPADSAAWEKADIDALQAGIRSAQTSGTGSKVRVPRVTQVWIVVTYTITSTGALDVTAAAATLSADGTVADSETTATAVLDVTAANATLEAAGVTPIDGDLDRTLAAATLISAGVTPTDGDLDRTLAAATLTSAVTTTATGSLDVTAANATLSASGTGATEATASLSVTTANATMSGAGNVTVSGSFSATTANATLSASGNCPVSASLSVTLANASISSEVDTTSSGVLSQTLGAATLSSEIDTTATGSLAQTMASAILSASGVASGATITAALIVTLAGATLATSGASVFPDNRRRNPMPRYPVFIGGGKAVIYKTRR